MFELVRGIFFDEAKKGSIIERADKLNFSDQERATLFTESLEKYHPYKLAQRLLALIYASLFAVAFLYGVMLDVMGLDYSNIVEIVTDFRLDDINMMIVGFYFLGGVIGGAARIRDKNSAS